MANVEGSAHFAAITVRYVMKSEMDTPHDFFFLCASASHLTYSDFTLTPPPRKSLNSIPTALEEFLVIVSLSLTHRNGEGERGVLRSNCRPTNSGRGDDNVPCAGGVMITIRKNNQDSTSFILLAPLKKMYLFLRR
jgi:hypothetical protein